MMEFLREALFVFLCLIALAGTLTGGFYAMVWLIVWSMDHDSALCLFAMPVVFGAAYLITMMFCSLAEKLIFGDDYFPY